MSNTRGKSLACVLALAVAMTTVLMATPGVASGEPDGLSFELGRTAPRPEAARSSTQLDTASATFATRATGMPSAGSQPHQQILPGAVMEVDYSYHWDTGVLEYHYSTTVTFGGLTPSGQALPVAAAGLGVFQGDNCVIDTADVETVYRSIQDKLLYGSGDATGSPTAGAWNCAAVAVTSPDGATQYDAYVSPLNVVTASPQLSVKAPRRDRLVKGVWTEVPLEVANAEASAVGARDVTVTGSGKGLKVKPLDLDGLAAGSDTSPHLWVKLSRPRAKLTVTVRETGTPVATSTVRLSRRPAPAKPLSGSYTGNSASFAVKGGKVRGFRVHTQTTCGGYPGQLEYTMNTYDFPTVGIPRNNEVSKGDQNDPDSYAHYSVYLRMEFVSRTKAKGFFTYGGPNRCRASESFVVKRKGR